jgi:hypothetical protein
MQIPKIYRKSGGKKSPVVAGEFPFKKREVSDKSLSGDMPWLEISHYCIVFVFTGFFMLVNCLVYVVLLCLLTMRGRRVNGCRRRHTQEATE